MTPTLYPWRRTPTNGEVITRGVAGYTWECVTCRCTGDADYATEDGARASLEGHLTTQHVTSPARAYLLRTHGRRRVPHGRRQRRR